MFYKSSCTIQIPILTTLKQHHINNNNIKKLSDMIMNLQYSSQIPPICMSIHSSDKYFNMHISNQVSMWKLNLTFLIWYVQTCKYDISSLICIQQHVIAKSLKVMCTTFLFLFSFPTICALPFQNFCNVYQKIL